MNCQRCGTYNNENAKYCVGCGAVIEAQPQVVRPARCVCGAELRPGVNFCMSCGRNINAANVMPNAANVMPNTANAMPNTANAMPNTANAIPNTVNAMPNTANAMPNMANTVPNAGNYPGNPPVLSPDGNGTAHRINEADVKMAVNTVKKILEHTSRAPSAPGEMRISMGSNGAGQVFSAIKSILK